MWRGQAPVAFGVLDDENESDRSSVRRLQRISLDLAGACLVLKVVEPPLDLVVQDLGWTEEDEVCSATKGVAHRMLQRGAPRRMCLVDQVLGDGQLPGIPKSRSCSRVALE